MYSTIAFATKAVFAEAPLYREDRGAGVGQPPRKNTSSKILNPALYSIYVTL